MMIAEGIHRLPTPVLMRHWREMLNHLVKSDFDHHAHHTRLMILIILICLSMAGDIHAQVSPEEHAKHHPGQASGSQSQSEESMQGKGMQGGKGMMGGGENGGGMMMGGGMMDGMMEKMGAPKQKEMYPRLMGLPDLPMEERMQIEVEAHQRMLDGARFMNQGFDQLTNAAPSNDFSAMQSATTAIREGLSQFESGLAAHRAIAEGQAPRNVAVQWFRKEMNLLFSAPEAKGFQLFGMSAFHTSIMAILLLFSGVMIWMYFFKMRRATELMQKLATGGTAHASTDTAADPSAANQREVAESKTTSPILRSKPATGSNTSAEDDCCSNTDVDCTDGEIDVDAENLSQGVLRVSKRKLCRLRVSQMFQETEDVKTFRLVACHGGPLPFSYLPGQFLTLKLPVGDKPIRRSYTISSSPTQGYYCEITVKREDQGIGSRYLCDNIQEGDTLEIQAPSGKFIFTGSEADSVVLIGGGVGITPMMSIARALTDMGWSGEIHFIAACRDPEHFIFKDELERLERKHANVHLHVAMSRIEKDMDGYRKGRLSKELFKEWIPDLDSQWVHLCGSPAMMDSTKAMLVELGIPADRIHTENFGSQQKPHVKAAARQAKSETAEPAAAGSSTGKVTFSKSEQSTSLEADETVLEAAERIGVDLDYSCRVGTCGICVAKLLAGDVTMEVEDGLEPDEKAAGMILTCQAKSTGDVTVEA